MNEDLRQRIIDSIAENEDLTQNEKETTINMTKGDDRIRVFSAERSIMKRLIAHMEFEIHQIRQRTSDGYNNINDDFDGEFDGRRRTVAVEGTLPVGALFIKPNSRNGNGHARTVSGRSSNLRLSQRGD